MSIVSRKPLREFARKYPMAKGPLDAWYSEACRAALERIDALMDGDPDPNSPEGQDLELLSVLVERYEEEQYPMDLPTPVEAIRFRMEQQRLKNREAAPLAFDAAARTE